jgi:hypothetical protein
MTFRLQEPEAPFQNATSRDWQKVFNPQRELGAFCSGVIGVPDHKWIEILEAVAVEKKGMTQLYPT